MNYYFEIAGIKIRIETDMAFDWNMYIKTFAIAPFEKADVIYILRMTDELHKPDGEIVYQGATCS